MNCAAGIPYWWRGQTQRLPNTSHAIEAFHPFAIDLLPTLTLIDKHLAFAIERVARAISGTKHRHLLVFCLCALIKLPQVVACRVRILFYRITYGVRLLQYIGA